MYRDNSQLRIEDFVFPYGKLDPENDWVRLAALVPWEVAEERYAARFVNNGHPAHPARMALGALLIQRRLKCSDQWLVKHIGENPYLQYFIGMKEYGPCPFGASTLVAFRKRFSEKDIAAILEASVPKGEAEGKDDSDDENGPPNSGTLVLDATCCPADIAYPQDIDLLNQAREKAEKTVDEMCEMTGQKKPRMYRKRARKDYLRLSKSKKRGGSAIRCAVRKQLQYIRRDIGYVAELVQKGAKLSSKQTERLNVVTTVYEQQRIMFESGTHSIPRRIVSLAQPWVRPIVRGKAHASTEFGAKLHISLVDGYARIERLDFEPFNESEDLWRAVARYRERYGCYPERILADKIYRNRQTLAFCKEHGIRLSGPALGKPPKNPVLSRQAKKQEYQDSCDRNVVEGIFGTGKTAYGLDRITAHLPETAACVIGVALLLLNLSRSLRSDLALFCLLSLVAILPALRSRPYFTGKGIVSGQKDGLFHPEAVMTSQEWAEILSSLGVEPEQFGDSAAPADPAGLYAFIWKMAKIRTYPASEYGYVSNLDAGTTAMIVTGLIQCNDVSRTSVSRGEALRLLHEIIIKKSVTEVPSNLVSFFEVTIGESCSPESETEVRSLLAKYPNNQLALLLDYRYQFIVLTDLSLAPNGHSEQLGFEDVGEHIIYLNESGIPQALLHEVGHAVETCHSSYSKTWKLNKAEGTAGAKFLGEYAGKNANEYIAEATRYFIENQGSEAALEKMKEAIPHTYEHLVSVMNESAFLTEEHFLTAVFDLA